MGLTAVKFNNYTKVLADIMSGALLVSGGFKLALTNTLPVVTQTTFDPVVAHPPPAAANGYPSGGFSVASIASASQNTVDAILTAAKQTISAVAGNLGPYRYPVLYVATNGGNLLLGFWDVGSSVTLTTGGQRAVKWSGVDGNGTFVQIKQAA